MTGNGLSASAAHLAEALVRSLGGVQVKVVLPIPFAIDMTEQALALSLPEIEEVTLEPVLLRTAGEAGEDGSQEYELLVPARAAQTLAELRQMASGEEMLRLARGVIVDQKWLRLLSVATEYCGAAPSLYRVRARERSDASSQG